MKVLLTFLPQQCDNHKFRWSNVQPPAAIYLLGAILKENDIETKIIDPSFYANKVILGGTNNISEDIFEDVDIIGLSSNSFNWGNTKSFIDFIKNINPDIKIVLGGVHPTFLDEYIMKTTKADVIIRGEGEKRLLEVVKTLRSNDPYDLSHILGITYKTKSKEIIRTKESPALSIEEFNQIVSPDYAEIPDNTYRILPFESSRGCLFDCTFCGVPFHKSWRPLHLENAIKKFDYTLEIAKKKLSTPTIVFGDDCFTVDKDRVKGIFKHINMLPGEFFINMEGRLSDLRDTSIMNDFPFGKTMQFSVGIENGYDKGLKMSRKGYTVEVIDKLFHNYKSKPYVLDKMFCSFIIGLPWETLEDCLKTIQFAAYLFEEYGVKCSLSWWCIIPSELWNRRSEFNINVDESIFDDPVWFETDVSTKVNKEKFFSYHPTLSMRDREKIDNLINFYFNRGINLTQR